MHSKAISLVRSNQRIFQPNSNPAFHYPAMVLRGHCDDHVPTVLVWLFIMQDRW